MSPTLGGSDSYSDRQFIAITSEKSARVIALPSQNCVYRQQIADTDYVVKAEFISFKGKSDTKSTMKLPRLQTNSPISLLQISDSVCLICYISTGHLVAYSLPSLRPLMDIDFLPLADLRYFQFTNKLQIIRIPFTLCNWEIGQTKIPKFLFLTLNSKIQIHIGLSFIFDFQIE